MLITSSFQIMSMLNTIETFDVLTTSKIEGIEPMSNKFQHIYANIKKKPYDILDHRRVDFDHDFDDFKRHISDLGVSKFPGTYCYFLFSLASPPQLRTKVLQKCEFRVTYSDYG